MDTTPVAGRIGGLSPDAFSSLFQAIGGLRNRPALIAMFGGLVMGIVLAALLGATAALLGFLGPLLGGLLALVAIWTGFNAAGVLLMDQAKGAAPRSLIDALVFGLMCIPKVIVLALAFLVVALAVFLVIALVYLVCKIPFLGPLLYVVAFPLSVVVAGITLWGLFVCMFLSLPAIWEGRGLMEAISQSLAIARTRLIETMLLMTFVGLLSMIVALLVFGVLGVGMVPAISLSAGIIGGGSGLGGLMGAMQGFGGAGAGHAVAGGIGFGILWAACVTLVWLVSLLGMNLVYLRVTEGLDASATQQALRQKLDEAKRRAADMSAKAKEAADRARESKRQPPPSAAPTTVPAGLDTTMPAMFTTPLLTCPKCSAAVTADDLFCESCGQRLK